MRYLDVGYDVGETIAGETIALIVVLIVVFCGIIGFGIIYGMKHPAATNVKKVKKIDTNTTNILTRTLHISRDDLGCGYINVNLDRICSVCVDGGDEFCLEIPQSAVRGEISADFVLLPITIPAGVNDLHLRVGAGLAGLHYTIK